MKVKIKELLKKRNITIKELSDASGIDYSSMYKIVNNENAAFIKFANLERIIQALDCNLTDLIEPEKSADVRLAISNDND